VDDQYGAVLGFEVVLNIRLGDRVAPTQFDFIHLHAQLARSLRVQPREVTVLEAQHALSRTQCVDERGLPGAGAAAREDHRFALLRLENATQARPDLGDEARHLRPPVIGHRSIHGAENPLRNVCGAGDLQKVATGSHVAVTLRSISAPMGFVGRRSRARATVAAPRPDFSSYRVPFS